MALAPHLAFAGTESETTGDNRNTVISADSEVYVALNAGRYRLADDIAASDLKGSLCVDIQQLFNALDFPILVDRAQNRASGWFIQENQTFAVDFRTGDAEVAGKRIQLDKDAIGELSSGPCLTTTALSQLLGLSLGYDARSTLISINSVKPLPIVERLERQARHKPNSLSLAHQATLPKPRSLPYRAFVPPNSDVTIAFSLDRSAETARRFGFGWSTLSVGELAYMTAEAQLSGTEAGLNGSVSRLRLYRSERDGGVFGNAKLTELSIGDITGYGSSLGSIGGVGLGFSASTFPLNRPTSFDRTSFVGDLPPGWDVELYRNGQLLEFDNDGNSGSYSFTDIPVLFGDNIFEIVQYGPQGQRRVITRRINASTFLAPKGTSYYRAALYRSELTFGKRIRGSGIRMDFRFARGVSENLNIGGGFDSYVVNDKRISVATLSAQTSLSGIAYNSEISATLEGKLAGQLEFQGNGRGAGFRGRLILAQQGYQTERVFGNIFARLEASADRAVELPGRFSGSLSGRFQFDRYHSGETSFTARQKFTLSHGNSWLSQALAWSHTSTGERRDVIDGEIAYNVRRGHQSFRTSIEYAIYPTPQVNRINAIVERSFSVNPESWRWRAEASWKRTEKEFGYLFAMSRNFKSLNFDLVAETNGKDTHRLGVNLSFSLGRRGSGWGITSRPLASSGTVRARVFEDLDDNGVFSDGDIPVNGASVMSNSSILPSMTNETGYAIIDGINANERAQITVQTEDLDDPNLFARSTYTMPREGTVSEISIPLTQMGAIEGTVSMVTGFEGRAEPIGGISLVLEDLRGQEISRTSSAYDGFYSFELVPVGSYRVVLAPDTALSQRLRPVQPVEVTTTRAEPGAQGKSMILIEKNPTNSKMALRGLI